MQQQRRQKQQQYYEIEPEIIEPLLFEEHLLQSHQPLVEHAPERVLFPKVDADFSNIAGFPSLESEQPEVQHLIQPEPQQVFEYSLFEPPSLIISGYPDLNMNKIESLPDLNIAKIESYPILVENNGQVIEEREEVQDQKQYLTEEQQLAEAIRLSQLEIQPKYEVEVDILDKFAQEQEKILQEAQQNRPLRLDQVTVIIDDYFAAPVVLSSEQQSAIIKSQLEKNNSQFQQIKSESRYKNLTENVMKQDLPDIVSKNGTAAVQQAQVQLTWINGRQFLIHLTKPTDTLQRLSLVYNVPMNLIKQFNDLLTDNLYSKERIMIPIVEGMILQVATPETEESKAKREMDRRENALRMMTEHIRRKLKQNGDFKPEATFYLSENSFDFLKAQAAYDADFSYDQGFQESKKDR